MRGKNLAPLAPARVTARRDHLALRPSTARCSLCQVPNRQEFANGLASPLLLEDCMRVAEFNSDQLETLMMAAFELLGRPEGQAQELARSILKAAERPQSGDPGPRDRPQG
jgi:hypothetical protein